MIKRLIKDETKNIFKTIFYLITLPIILSVIMFLLALCVGGFQYVVEQIKITAIYKILSEILGTSVGIIFLIGLIVSMIYGIKDNISEFIEYIKEKRQSKRNKNKW